MDLPGTMISMTTMRSKHPAQVAYLVDEIVATCRDARSRRYYAKVARALPDHILFEFLAEIRQDVTIRNRGAVFVAKVKRYTSTHPSAERPESDRTAPLGPALS